ncbi:hypothetical protein F2Q70_00028592 [Brassica cretica]|uniref:Uncharacterized protein n=1 Tax=Brassica cretica TaxID=69181 RepID=A0A8S9LAU3_BRACR|nr:hypothetical protein F2Q70_00028592 [Brassica cretica]
MASVNLQVIAVLNQEVQQVLNFSHEKRLIAQELDVLFHNHAVLFNKSWRLLARIG